MRSLDGSIPTPVRLADLEVYLWRASTSVSATEAVDLASQAGDTLKEAPCCGVRRVRSQWIVKQWRPRPIVTRVYQALRLTPAWRQWRGAAGLVAAGVRCGAPAALVHDRSTGVQRLLLPFVPGRTLHDLARDSTASTAACRRSVARRIGGQIGALLAAGLVNRDHKPTNLILDEAAQRGDAPPTIIDTAGIRRRRSDAQVYRMLAVLDRSLVRAGPVCLRDRVGCLRELLRVDVRLARGHADRLRHVFARVTALRAARPLSYDPATLPGP